MTEYSTKQAWTDKQVIERFWISMIDYCKVAWAKANKRNANSNLALKSTQIQRKFDKSWQGSYLVYQTKNPN